MMLAGGLLTKAKAFCEHGMESIHLGVMIQTECLGPTAW